MPNKRRRSGADIQAIRDAILGILRDDHPMTVRQVFYQLVCAGRLRRPRRSTRAR